MRVMTKKGLLIALAFLLFAPNILGQSNSPAKALSDSIRRVVFDGKAFFGEGQASPAGVTAISWRAELRHFKPACRTFECTTRTGTVYARPRSGSRNLSEYSSIQWPSIRAGRL
jgi:hypothetical protein